MNLKEFSNGYYKTEMTVQPYSDGPVIDKYLYDFINREVYAQTDAPITMRVGLNKGPYFSVDGEGAMPTDVLAMPQPWIDDMDLGSETESIFLLKPEHSFIINQTADL